MSEQRLQITLVKSMIGRQRKQRLVLQGLGLRKINQSVVRLDRPEIRGMVRKVIHLVKVTELPGGEGKN